MNSKLTLLVLILADADLGICYVIPFPKILMASHVKVKICSGLWVPVQFRSRSEFCMWHIFSFLMASGHMHAFLVLPQTRHHALYPLFLLLESFPKLPAWLTAPASDPPLCVPCVWLGTVAAVIPCVSSPWPLAQKTGALCFVFARWQKRLIVFSFTHFGIPCF